MAKYALVIGLDRYDHFGNLKSAAKDAEAVARLLEQHQYRVTRLPRTLVGENQWVITPDKSLSHTELGNELKSFFRERAKNQEAILYFAGHGFRVSDALTGEESGYLATSNATKDGQNAIPFASLNKLMGQAELSSLVVIMDCCYAGSLLEEQRSLLQPTQTILSHKQNSCLIAACRDFERAREGKDHGIFTAAILKGLSAENAVQETVTSNDLFGFVDRELRTSGQEVIHAGMGGAIALVHYPKQSTSTVEQSTTSARVFISYRSQPPDSDLAEEFYKALKAEGHEVFMAAESIRLGDNWSQRIDRELEQCDYFLLLLSPKSATSEMVTEEVRRAKELRDTRDSGKPGILPVRVDFPLSSPLNYDLRGYLNRIQQREWSSPDDTSQIMQEVLNILATGKMPKLTEQAEKTLPPVSWQEALDDPPLPVAEPELRREPGGKVRLDSGLYMKRPPIEKDCYEEVEQPGALIRIKAPRQMGKTSLMARILDHARNQGYRTLSLSFQQANGSLLSNLDDLLRWFSEQVGDRLDQLHQMEPFWSENRLSKDKCQRYFERCLLTDLEQPIVIGLDEVDRVFPYREVADDFFGLLRYWHEAAGSGDVNSDLWDKVRLVIVHSTEVYVPLDINQSPFNVGKSVELPEFNMAQIKDLSWRYELCWKDSEVEQLMMLVGGHPFLVRKALYHIRRGDITLKRFSSNASTESGIYSDHLRRHLMNLQTYPYLAEALSQVVMKSQPVDLNAEVSYKLDSMGLIKLDGNQAVPRCDVYRQYFREHLTALPT